MRKMLDEKQKGLKRFYNPLIERKIMIITTITGMLIKAVVNLITITPSILTALLLYRYITSKWK